MSSVACDRAKLNPGFLLFLVLTGCATSDSRPTAAPEAMPTAAPIPAGAPGELAMAMDPTTDPVPPGGHPDVTSIGDTTLALTNAGYDVVYSETKQNPLVVEYFLRPRAAGDVENCDDPDFHTDNRTQSRVKKGEYTNTGYDRGHMAPNAAIRRRFGCEAQRETFLMSNIVPQLPGLNQRTWESYEKVVETEYAGNFEGVWVQTGPVFNPTKIVTLCDTDIEVPVEFWKIVVRRKPDGKVDTAGVVMKKSENREKPIRTFSTTIDDIEARSGIDFFPDLAPAQEAALESACPSDDWLLDMELEVSFPGTPRPICEDSPRDRPQSLGTQTSHAVVCGN